MRSSFVRRWLYSLLTWAAFLLAAALPHLFFLCLINISLSLGILYRLTFFKGRLDLSSFSTSVAALHVLLCTLSAVL